MLISSSSPATFKLIEDCGCTFSRFSSEFNNTQVGVFGHETSLVFNCYLFCSSRIVENICDKKLENFKTN